MKNGIKLRLLRLVGKFLIKIGGRIFLSASMASLSRKIADSILKNIIPQEGILDIQGFKIKIGKETRFLPLIGYYEPSVTSLIKKEVKKGMQVFDLGANIGWFTLFLSKQVGNTGHVYSFEPDPYYYKILKENVELNNLENVSIFQLAVSDKNGTARFNLNEWFGTYVLESKTRTDNSITVETITLDEFCKKHRTRIDFLKMDIEGSEPKAFAGMKDSIMNNSSIRIVSEFNPDAIIDTGYSPKEHLNSLESVGFVINQIVENHSGEFKPAQKEKLLKLGKNSANLYCFKP